MSVDVRVRQLLSAAFDTVSRALADERKEFLRFDAPAGMHVDADGRIYIVEMRRNRVRVYKVAD